jgi:hypothetical protein
MLICDKCKCPHPEFKMVIKPISDMELDDYYLDLCNECIKEIVQPKKKTIKARRK